MADQTDGTDDLARRAAAGVELVREVRGMKDRGHTLAEIARKTDLDPAYVRGIIQHLDRGETRLLFTVVALRQLFRDDHFFVTLLRAEGLDTLPEYLADQLAAREGTP
jgi:hypothetical protein